jgi:hypothetical protein
MQLTAENQKPIRHNSCCVLRPETTLAGLPVAVLAGCTVIFIGMRPAATETTSMGVVAGIVCCFGAHLTFGELK